jgi:hypothetical protein
MRHKKKLIQWATTMAFYSILVRDEIQNKLPKTSIEVDKLLKRLSRVDRLSAKIRESLLGGIR